MNKIILSFDYEIYFDGSNAYQQLLLKTNRILKIAESYNVKLVFFIDVLYIVKLEEFELYHVSKLIKDQVFEIKSKGHELQFHFHPHWLNSVYDSENELWLIDDSEFSYSDLIDKYGINIANEYFEKSYDQFRSYFNVTSSTFRAGGLSINKYQKEFIQILQKNGFVFDSSVLPDLLLKGKNLVIDHTHTPQKDQWKIDSDTGFFKASTKQENCLTEIPIMTVDSSKISIFKRILTSFKYRLSRLIHDRKISDVVVHKMIDLNFDSSHYPVSITFDKSSKSDIILLKHFTHEYFSGQYNVMCILSHPKSLKDISFDVFDRYIAWCKQHSTKYKFIVYKDLI
ncbi:MAG TPA: hypothetical protein VGF79_12260 [Bacteroidia bacterium]